MKLTPRFVHTLGASWRRLRADRKGAALVWTGLSLIVFVGFSGMGLDASKWFMERRIMQSAVDAAAIAATHALATGGDQTALEAAVADSMTRNAFIGRGDDVLQVITPPVTGSEAGNTSAVEVALNRNANLYFSSVIVDGEVHIETRAIGAILTIGEHCVLGLDHHMEAAVEFTGTANAVINCGVASNSSDDKSIEVSGNASLTADPAQAYGDIYVGGSADLITNSPPQPYAARVVDPFGPEGRALVIPASLETDTCVPSPVHDNAPGPIPPLVPDYYCGDFDLKQKIAFMSPGTYIIEDGDFKMGSQSILTGTGVTIILVGSTPDDVGIINLTSGSTVTLSAPTTGPYAGILFYVDQSAESYIGGNLLNNHVIGGANTTLTGAIYSASREVTFTGGSSTGSTCLQLVAKKVTFIGNAVINNTVAGCNAIGLDPIDQIRIRLAG
jgi:Flp pilus assembly protein TadG